MKIGIICASGIGDGLLFLPLAHSLEKMGHAVTIHSNHLQHFGTWFSKYQLEKQPSLSEIINLSKKYDAIFLQHDNSEKAKEIEKLPLLLYRFYGAHSPTKHEPLDIHSYVCDPSISMVENIERAAHLLFKTVGPLDRSYQVPPNLIHKRATNRIIIHPTASTAEKMWPKKKYLKLADYLKNKGFTVVFAISPQESSNWPFSPISTLEDLSSLIYESGFFIGNDSGPAHLASFLDIPHLVIGGNGLQMPLWKTGWLQGALLIPSKKLMKFKILRKKWHLFINVKEVINKIINIK